MSKRILKKQIFRDCEMFYFKTKKQRIRKAKNEKIKESKDVLVKWEDGTKNIVSRRDIEPCNSSDVLQVGCKLKLFWPIDIKY